MIADSDPRPVRSRSAGARSIRALAWLSILSTVALLVAFRGVGERAWPVAALLYVPRLPLLLPVAVLLPLLLRIGSRRLFVVEAFAGIALLFPIGGLNPRLPTSAPSTGAGAAPSIRILSYNVFYGRQGERAIRSELEAAHADVVVFQATSPRAERFLRAAYPDWTIVSRVDFLLATRFPVRDVYQPPEIPGDDPADEPGSAAYIRYTLETPLGPIDLFNCHPNSPRDGLSRLRYTPATAVARIARNAAHRERQVEALAAAAHAARNPVVIAGDTNLPGMSEIFRRHLGDYQDGFVEAGAGFGYTFPANKIPWMRIDRILAGTALRFVHFFVGGRRGSDHCPVIADLVAR